MTYPCSWCSDAAAPRAVTRPVWRAGPTSDSRNHQLSPGLHQASRAAGVPTTASRTSTCAISLPPSPAVTSMSAARPCPAGAEVNITGPLTKGMGDVRDLDVSPDGDAFVFSLRLPLNPKKGEHRGQLTELAHLPTMPPPKTSPSSPMTTSLPVTMWAARYLPDGRIVFASTRHQRPNPSCSRGPAPIPGRHEPRSAGAGHLSAARHERRRHRHASNQFQHQPRFRAHRY